MFFRCSTVKKQYFMSAVLLVKIMLQEGSKGSKTSSNQNREVKGQSSSCNSAEEEIKIDFYCKLGEICHNNIFPLVCR